MTDIKPVEAPVSVEPPKTPAEQIRAAETRYMQAFRIFHVMQPTEQESQEFTDAEEAVKALYRQYPDLVSKPTSPSADQ